MEGIEIAFLDIVVALVFRFFGTALAYLLFTELAFGSSPVISWRPASQGGYYNFMDGHFITVQMYVPQKSPSGKRYSVLKVSLRDFTEKFSIPRELIDKPIEECIAGICQKIYVPAVMEFVEKFVRSEYLKRKRGLALEALSAERRFFHAPATWVIVTDENDLERIHAVMRVVRKEKLPLELDEVLLQQVSRGNDSAAEALFQSQEDAARLDVENHLNFKLPDTPMYWDRNKKRYLSGWGEMKSFVVAKDFAEEEKFTRLMIYALAIQGQHILPQGFFNAPFKSTVKTSGLTTIEVENHVGLSHFVLETDRLGARLWKSFGFSEYRSFQNGEVVVMTAPLNDFERAAIREQSETGEDFRQTLWSSNYWQPYPVLPLFTYKDFYRDRSLPPKIQVGPLEITCSSLMGRLSTPFYTFDPNEIGINWKIHSQ